PQSHPFGQGRSHDGHPRADHRSRDPAGHVHRDAALAARRGGLPLPVPVRPRLRDQRRDRVEAQRERDPRHGDRAMTTDRPTTPAARRSAPDGGTEQDTRPASTTSRDHEGSEESARRRRLFRTIAARVLSSLAVLWAAVTIVFVLSRASGDPTTLLLPEEATAEQKAQLRETLGLDRPLLTQYLYYLQGLLTLDLGESLRYNEPEIGRRRVGKEWRSRGPPSR